jgi:hypothetical protein
MSQFNTQTLIAILSIRGLGLAKVVSCHWFVGEWAIDLVYPGEALCIPRHTSGEFSSIRTSLGGMGPRRLG